MRIILFVQSLISDWNHGNAHFLRGVVSELIRRNHDVKVYEPFDSWSLKNLVRFEGYRVIDEFHDYYPDLYSIRYHSEDINIDMILDNADLVIVHEWNDPSIVKRIGFHRKNNPGYILFFHDTHHRVVTDPYTMAGYDLRYYDGVLAFGEKIRSIYLENGWIQRAWTWHEAADTNIFKPIKNTDKKKDLVWIGNWGDEERSNELREFLFEPARNLALKCSVYGVRFPKNAIDLLYSYGIEHCGWLPNYSVPQIFSEHLLTIHVPRKPYVKLLSGIPTIRPFEAMACGIPLVCSPWDDCEGLFRKGRDYLVANNGIEMEKIIKALINDREFANEIAFNGFETVMQKHTCVHRVNELFKIIKELNGVKTGPKINEKHKNGEINE
ncbi:MAG TPA: glycosyltransferase [Chitinispirillaceae bacterium]|nr:glycosyltransferase [Chitinispirillaceae bacterium]